MKEIAALILIMLLLVFTTSLSFAQTPTKSDTKTPTPNPSKATTTDNLTKQISNLKERIASRVAELNLVEKRGIVGIATDVKGTEFTLTDIRGRIRFVDVDELTKFIGSDSKTTFGISDIKKGVKLAVLGRYNKQSERLLARFVEVVSIPEYINGTVKNLDEDNFSFVLTSSSGKDTPIDVETLTKTQSYSKEDGATKSGFSQIALGDQVLVSGFPDKNDAKRIVATRVLVFTDFRSGQEEEKTTVSPTKTTLPSPTQADE